MNKSKIVAALEKLQAAQRLPAEEKNTVLESLVKAMDNMARITAFTGPTGPKPIKGVDYFTRKEILEFLKLVTPVKGKDYRDGEDGEDGYTPRKGIDYFDGKDGEDGKDADISEVFPIVEREVKEHEGKHDHALIHDPKTLGTLELDQSNAKDGLFLQLQGSKLIFAAPPEFVQQRSWYQSSGSSLTDFFRVRTVTETGNIEPEDRILHIDATAGDITLTMHTAEGHDRRSHYIKRIDATANTVTISPTGSETLEFQTTNQLPFQGSGVEYYADGGNWYTKHT